MPLPGVPDTTPLGALCAKYLRPVFFDATGSPAFDPPLTTAEQTIFDDLLKMAHFGLATSLTLDEFRAMKPALADARAVKATIVPLRTRTPAQWNALSATQREADQITYLNALADGLNDVVTVLEALLRDS